MHIVWSKLSLLISQLPIQENGCFDIGLCLLLFFVRRCPLISKGPMPQKPQVGYSYCFWSSLNKLVEVKQQTHGVSHCLWGGNWILGCLADNDSFLKECKLFSQKDNLVQFTADLRVSPSFSDTRSWSMDVYTWSILELTKLFGQAMAPKKKPTHPITSKGPRYQESSPNTNIPKL